MSEAQIRLYRADSGCAVEHEGKCYVVEGCSWDQLVGRDDLEEHLRSAIRESRAGSKRLEELEILAPIGAQEVWAAGVTYYRSRDARMEESKSAGGGDFYERVYAAARPELFMKATPHRVVGPNRKVAIRDDAKWSVPEPELTLLITPSGKITG